VRSAEYLDLDTGLAVITRHARSLGYDALVLFLDELILWLSGRISDHAFVNTEGAKLNKLVESADSTRPIPLISFVARQRNLEEFLGPHVGGTEREALAQLMTSVQGRLGEIALADTNLPEITEKRLLRPKDEGARAVIDNAFAAVRGNREVWDTLLLGAQYGDAGVGSDATAFRKLYPFSPALVATLVALSQALQRERTALKVMTELLVERRGGLRVGDLIGVAELFEPLVLHGELPDRPKLKQMFEAARTLYLRKLRPLLLNLNGITEPQSAGHTQFALDDKLIKTLLLGALVPDVPALHNLTASKLHTLNFGSITSPIPGYENQIVLNRLKKIQPDAGELQITDDPEPVVSLTLHTIDFDKLLDLVPRKEFDAPVRQRLLRELVTAEMGLLGADETLGELQHPREWRGRRHTVQVKFGNVRDPDAMPVSTLVATGETWRVVIDYPFDPEDYPRSADRARISELPRGSHTVFWLPLYLTDEMMGRVVQLAQINYLLGTAGGTGIRLDSLAADWPKDDRRQGAIYLGQRQAQLRDTLVRALKQAYGAASPEPTEVQDDPVGVLHTLADGLRIGDPRGGTLKDAFQNLTGELLDWSYPGTPAMPVDEKPITRAELAKVYEYARLAAADPTHGVSVPQADQRTLRRICNNLRLGELIDHRYVLDINTCWWSQHLLQGAAKQDHTAHFPVHLLRELLDEPKARGFDRDLQNLIILVFALEQQLAWYEHGGKITVNAAPAVRDEYELRHPPMPDEQKWKEAVRRGQPFFGEVLPLWRTPANLAELAGTMRRVAGRYREAAGQLVVELTRHAGDLGLDATAPVGRLATARRVARLLDTVAAETDDVVLVNLVADADLGGLDEAAASEAFKQAQRIVTALARTQWPLLTAIAARAAGDERARVIIEQLRSAARHEQHGSDLIAALETAVGASAALLAEGATAGSGAAGTTASGTAASGTAAGGATRGGLGSLDTVGGQDDRREPGSPEVTRYRHVVHDRATLEAVTKQIAAEIDAGLTVTLTWETR
jgi:hypothetical protein